MGPHVIFIFYPNSSLSHLKYESGRSMTLSYTGDNWDGEGQPVVGSLPSLIGGIWGMG
jgi:hypothetical protein